MSLNININTSATRVANRLHTHYDRLNQAVSRLSSGSKLNSSEDNPVQMANHNIYKGKIAVYNAGLINLNEAVSMAQTAESAVEKIGDNLIRMKEIAEQVSTGTYTNEQRVILQSEFAIMGIEIDRIATFTDFKGTHLLDGTLSNRNNTDRMGSWYQTVNQQLNEDKESMTGLKIHFGDSSKESEDFYFLKMNDLRMKGLLKDYRPDVQTNNKIAVSTQEAAQLALTAINTALANKDKARIYAGIFQNRLNSTMNHLENHVDRISDIDSKISDMDIAEEMTQFTTYQMLTETATAMLSQANILPQIALKLLNK